MPGRLHWQAIAYLLFSFGKDSKRLFFYRRSRTFFTAKGGLFVFAALQPADRQARMGMAANGRERALDDIADTHKRKGRSPEKPQIFLYLYQADYAYYNRQQHFFLVI